MKVKQRVYVLFLGQSVLYVHRHPSQDSILKNILKLICFCCFFHHFLAFCFPCVLRSPEWYGRGSGSLCGREACIYSTCLNIGYYIQYLSVHRSLNTVLCLKPHECWKYRVVLETQPSSHEKVTSAKSTSNTTNHSFHEKNDRNENLEIMSLHHC